MMKIHLLQRAVMILYIEYITLMNMCGEYERAYRCIMGTPFHPGRAAKERLQRSILFPYSRWQNSAWHQKNMNRQRSCLKKHLYIQKIFGEGKLEGTKDNHLFYHLGLALEAQGKHDEAKTCFETATIGTDEPAGAMYYNDQPADMILYQGLAFEKLGKTREGKITFLSSD